MAGDIPTDREYLTPATFMDFSAIAYAFYLFSFAEQLHSVHDDKRLETDFSQLNRVFRAVGCTDKKAVIWKILEKAPIQLNVDQRVINLPFAPLSPLSQTPRKSVTIFFDDDATVTFLERPRKTATSKEHGAVTI